MINFNEWLSLRESKAETHPCDQCGEAATTKSNGINNDTGNEEWSTVCSNPNCPSNRNHPDRHALGNV